MKIPYEETSEMEKIPVSLIIDDPAPGISVYHSHHKTGYTDDGRPVLEYVPNSFLFTFCDIIETYGIKGKFSVVPMPGNRGDIVRGISGVPMEQIREWLDTLKTRIMPRFSVGPEMLTHNKAVDLRTGEALELNERDWAVGKDRSVLTPYIARAFSLLKEAGIESCGVTSPWNFGITVEEEYVAAISRAAWEVYGIPNTWYFLRGLRDTPHARPWIALEDGERCVVSIPATARDCFWQSIHTPDQSEAFVSRMADELLTEDGKSGEIVRILENDSWPILITHWQSLLSNGLGTGLRALAEVGRRIGMHYANQLEWMSYEEILKLVLADKKAYPKPIF